MTCLLISTGKDIRLLIATSHRPSEYVLSGRSMKVSGRNLWETHDNAKVGSVDSSGNVVSFKRKCRRLIAERGLYGQGRLISIGGNGLRGPVEARCTAILSMISGGRSRNLLWPYPLTVIGALSSQRPLGSGRSIGTLSLRRRSSSE